MSMAVFSVCGIALPVQVLAMQSDITVIFFTFIILPVSMVLPLQKYVPPFETAKTIDVCREDIDGLLFSTDNRSLPGFV